MSALHTFHKRLTVPVDAAGLVYFRVLFGVVVIWKVGHDVTHGLVAAYWMDPSFLFSYGPFDFVRPWPDPGMYVHMAVTALAALGVALALFYRWSAVVMWLGLTYLFLLDQSTYVNTPT